MKIYSVHDPEFTPYGSVITGYDTTGLIAAMKKIEMPAGGVDYKPSIPLLEAEGIYGLFKNNAYGGMPVQLGLCWGYNTRLNCLEYHRDSELNIGAGDFILLLAKQCEIEDGILETSKVKAFRAPAGVPVEIYATTLHYAPCHVDADEGFRVAIVLPAGTNTDAPGAKPLNEEDKWLTARNKWLLAHPDSAEAKDGAHIGLKGENIDLNKK